MGAGDFVVLMSFDEDCTGIAETVSENIQRELVQVSHPAINTINVDMIAREDRRVDHQGLVADWVAQHPQQVLSQLYVLCFVKDGDAEQYRGVKALCALQGISNQVILQLQNLQDPSLLLRNLAKQVVATFSSSAAGSGPGGRSPTPQPSSRGGSPYG
eukprot:RCo051144